MSTLHGPHKSCRVYTLELDDWDQMTAELFMDVLADAGDLDTARADGGEAESPAAYQFTSSEVLWGLRRRVLAAGQERQETLCLGLIDEWREWQRAADPRFDLLKRLLAALGPDDQRLEPGALVRPSIDDVREIPTIRIWSPPPGGRPLPLWSLELDEPFLARELRRQGRLNPEDVQTPGKTPPIDN